MTKDELLEKYADINVDDGWWTDTYKDFIDCLALAGITTYSRGICFTGFWSQGDGAQFRTFDHDLLGLVQAAQKWMLEQWPDYEGKGENGADAGGPIIAALHRYCVALLDSQEVYLMDGDTRSLMEDTAITVSTRSGTYCHSGGMSVEVTFAIDNYPDDDSTGGDLEALFTEHMRALADALYKTLQEEYEFQTAEEQVWEAIVANGLDEELTHDEEEEPCNA